MEATTESTISTHTRPNSEEDFTCLAFQPAWLSLTIRLFWLLLRSFLIVPQFAVHHIDGASEWVCVCSTFYTNRGTLFTCSVCVHNAITLLLRSNSPVISNWIFSVVSIRCARFVRFSILCTFRPTSFLTFSMSDERLVTNTKHAHSLQSRTQERCAACWSGRSHRLTLNWFLFLFFFFKFFCFIQHKRNRLLMNSPMTAMKAISIGEKNKQVMSSSTEDCVSAAGARTGIPEICFWRDAL